MGALSLLGKSKTAKSLLLAGALVLSSGEFPGNAALHAQAKQTQNEELKKEFVPRAPSKPNKYKKIRVGPYISPENFAEAGDFIGVNIKVSPLGNRFYRYNEPVLSVPEYLLGLYKEAGYEVDDRSVFMEDMRNTLGVCFRDEYVKNEVKYRFVIPIYRRVNPSVGVFAHAHEDWHGIQFLECNECYSVLEKRLENRGYRIVFSDFDEEEQADVAGILMVLENNLPLEPVFERCRNTRDVYKKMQRYRISEPIRESIQSPFFPKSELYKPANTNK
jgi:hypothetical protein